MMEKYLGVLNKDRIYQKEMEVNLNEEKFKVKLPLLGEHQIGNMLVALKAFQVICEEENYEINLEEIKILYLR